MPVRRIGAVVLLVALTVAACSSRSEPEIDATTTSTTLAVIQPTTTAAPAASVAEKPYGGEVRLLALFPETMNPYLDGLTSFPDTLFNVAPAIFLGATQLSSETGERIPGVLTEAPTSENGGVVISPDGTTTVTYEIHPDAVWEDGTPVSGHDFEFTYRQIVEHADDLGIFNTDLYLRIDPESVVAEDKVFIFTLDAFAVGLDALFPVVVPKHQVEGTSFLEDWNETPWMSAGPFRFTELVPSSHLVLERNDAYWRTDPETGQQLPYLDRLRIGQFIPETFAVIEDGELRSLAIRDAEGDGTAWDEVDAMSDDQRAAYNAAWDEAIASQYARGVVDAYWAIPQTDVDIGAIVADGEAGAAILVAKQSGTELIAFQFGDWRNRANAGSLMEHPEFRQAIAHAIDRDEVAAEVYGEAVLPLEPYVASIPNFRLDSLVEIGSPSLSQQPWSAYSYDPERARELLESLCADLDRDCEADPPRWVILSTDWNLRVAAIEQMASDLAEVGVLVETRLDSLLWPHMVNEPWEAALFQWNVDPGLAGLAGLLSTADPDSLPWEFGDNFYHWGTPAVSGIEDDPETEEIESNFNQGPSSSSGPAVERYRQLVETMNGSDDPALVEAAILEAEQILADELVVLPLYQRPLVVVWNPAIGGYAFRLTHLPETWNIAEWYRTDL
jgi:ABC-type transport system substrate-binding protein